MLQPDLSLDDVSDRFRFWRPRTRMTGTYTQAGRNSESIAHAAMVASQHVGKGDEMDTLVIGPGAVLNFVGSHKPGKLQRKLESVARKLPLTDSVYASFECVELTDALVSRQLSTRLTVMDRSERVLDIAGRSVEKFSPDLVQSSLEDYIPALSNRFDLILCCNVLYHVPAREAWLAARQNILDYCARDCVVVCDDSRVFIDTEFREEAKHVFVRY